MKQDMAVAGPMPARGNLAAVRTTWAEALWLRLLRVAAKLLGTVLIISGLGLLTAVGALWYYQKAATDHVNQVWLSQQNNATALSGLPAVPTAPAKAAPAKAVAPVRTAVADLPATRIVIPSIGVDSKIVEVHVVMGRWQVAAYAVGHSVGTADPGQPGNMVLAAHDDELGEIFRYLGNVKVGDPIIVYTAKGQYVYIVQSTPIVPPTDVGVMSPTSDNRVTLITCTPYWVDTMRQIIIAKLYQDPTPASTTIVAD